MQRCNYLSTLRFSRKKVQYKATTTKKEGTIHYFNAIANMTGFVAVHTGAGNCIDETKYQRVIKEAGVRATDILKNGGSAMDAVEAAIMRLENCGNTNAGFGSNLCWDGRVQCDASIMNGSNLHFGACTNVSTVRNPIRLARLICDGQSTMLSMERIPPMVMAGSSAERYAEELGCTMIDASAMISSKAKFSYNHYKSKIAAVSPAAEGTTSTSNRMSTLPVVSAQVSALDIVGAVCVDSNGNTAAGCSSGGLLLKVPGRVGQAATYGAQTFMLGQYFHSMFVVGQKSGIAYT
ncbi:threonine aspartase 1-like [Rhagoletis pomonella]|uniref:threonine aspartase 1-like n=1 Tax=Rhagoletis pomonella TaxID=28610 RepID=UPI00177B2184|nr:threonine aspartase 1-like [Rhagoletis pomonella]